MTTAGGRRDNLEISFPDSPDRAPVRLSRGTRLVAGRALDCQICLNNASVSRQHAAIEVRDEGVFLEDLGSRHGTRLNEIPLRAGRPVRIQAGDVLQLGPSLLRVDPCYARVKTDLITAESDHVRTIMLSPQGGAEHSLRMLIDAVRSIPSEVSEETAGRMMLDRLLQATGLERGLIVRLSGGTEAQIVASAGAQLGSVSRSLLAAAADPNQVAHLSQEDDLRFAHSVVGSGVREALAVRLMVRGDDDHYMYLDSRNATGDVETEMAEFVGAAARICGFVFESIARRRDEETMRDVRRAREVQQRLLPEAVGAMSGLAWHLECRPGSLLAGDFVGVAPRPDGSCLAWVGDVVGKGAPAAMLMAAAQSWLHSAAARGDSPSRAVTDLNEFLARRSASDEFATLFLVAIHPDGRIEACDAGHGIAFMVGVHGARKVDSDGGPPVGAAEGIDFGSSELVLERGDRLLLVTDGVHEQRSREGDQFGLERIMGVLGATRTGADDVGTLLAELSRFAGERFDDDVTILSITRS